MSRPLATDILREHSPVIASLEEEDTTAYVGFFTSADFALAIEVPNGLGERLQNIRSLLLKHVVHVMRGDDIGFTTL